MLVDAELKVRGLDALTKSLGMVEAERFVFLMQRDRMDYTKWRKNLFDGLSGEEISRQAMEFAEKTNQSET
jgi:hypothetical protein